MFTKIQGDPWILPLRMENVFIKCITVAFTPKIQAT